METTGAGGASACSEGVACPHAAPYHMVVQLCCQIQLPVGCRRKYLPLCHLYGKPSLIQRRDDNIVWNPTRCSAAIFFRPGDVIAACDSSWFTHPYFMSTLSHRYSRYTISSCHRMRGYTNVAADASHKQDIGDSVTFHTDSTQSFGLEKTHLLYSCHLTC